VDAYGARFRVVTDGSRYLLEEGRVLGLPLRSIVEDVAVWRLRVPELASLSVEFQVPMRGCHSTHHFYYEWSLVADHDLPSKTIETATQVGNPRNSIQLKGTTPEEGLSEGGF
jgi:hypothetical protein